jgi:hypothetical protein
VYDSKIDKEAVLAYNDSGDAELSGLFDSVMVDDI